MSKYVWICLNNTKYDWICHYIPEKNSAECARILNVSDAVHNIRWLYRLQCSYQDRDLFRTLTSIQDVAVCKKNNAWVQLHNQNWFRARVGEVCGTMALR